MSWKEHYNRATDAPYEILDGAVSRGVLDVDQSVRQIDEWFDGTWWKSLGVVRADSGESTLRRATTWTATWWRRRARGEAADGVVSDDGSLGYSDSGWTVGAGTGGYAVDYRYAPPGTGTGWADWMINIPAGIYEVYATWTGELEPGPSDGPLPDGWDGGTQDLPRSASIDQRSAPMT